MCKLLDTNIHWCWRYLSAQTNFSNILSIWANKNCNKSAIVNLIKTKLYRIHGRIVVNACVEYRGEMFIGVGDIHPDGQNFQIFCQFEPTKIAISRPFWISSGQNLLFWYCPCRCWHVDFQQPSKTALCSLAV